MTTDKQIDFPPLPEPTVNTALQQYPPTAYTARQMRDYVAADRAQRQARQEPVAWLYKSGADFDGNEWHDSYEVTTSKQVAQFKNKNAVPLYTAAPRSAHADQTSEIARLTACLTKANAQTEQFERKSYLQDDEIAALKAALQAVLDAEDEAIKVRADQDFDIIKADYDKVIRQCRAAMAQAVQPTNKGATR